MELSLILGITNDAVIGINNDCIYSTADKEHFRTVTQYTDINNCNLLIVGRKTWETLPAKMKQCSKRKYLIVTRQTNYINENSNSIVVNSFDAALQYSLTNRDNYYKIFVIGGGEIYRCAMESGFVTEIFLTGFGIHLEKYFTQPAEFVRYQIPLNKFTLKKYNKIRDNISIKCGQETLIQECEMIFCYYKREYQNFEVQYMNLLNDIITNGVSKNTRNSITMSVTDRQLKIDLADGFPILTVRRSFWRGIVEELLWMMMGSTNANILKARDIHIWDGNTTREFLDRAGLNHLPEGDIGAGYGFQMRYNGADYIDCNTNYQGRGVDQLVSCVNQIKGDPNSRRIIINLWNAADLKKMSLPACHLLYQFTVTEGKLSCHLYQRSWDVMLGWNTSTAALLTHILAHYCDLAVGTLTHTICDVHIYEQHLETFQVLRNRVPYRLPKLEITGTKPDKIDGYCLENFKLVDYKCHPNVKMAMVA